MATLVSNGQQQGHPILLIECILGIYQQKTPILIMLVQPPEVLYRMDASLDTCSQTSTKLVYPSLPPSHK